MARLTRLFELPYNIFEEMKLDLENLLSGGKREEKLSKKNQKGERELDLK